MPDWIDLVAMCLATWRLSHMLVYEEGPWDIFWRIRNMFGIEHYEDGSIAGVPEKVMAKLFGCLPCMSIWMAGLVYLVWHYEPIPVWIVAASGCACLINRRY